MNEERKIKLKSRLNFDGYVLFPLYVNMMLGDDKQFFNEIKTKYGKQVDTYVRSVSAGGSKIKHSLPPVVCGPREKLNKFLAVFLVQLEDYQGMKFGIDDLKVIKSKKEEEEEEYTFNSYSHISIADLHKNTIESTGMERWRMECIREALTSRQRRRKPMILLSEKPLGEWFNDSSTFTYINLFSNKEMEKQHKAEDSDNSIIVDDKTEQQAIEY